MSRIIKILLIIFLFIGFFEVGLISSYTIVTSEAPDIQELIDLQIDAITGLFTSENINEIIVRDPESINITNSIAVANTLKSLAKIDGVNIDTMNVTTYENPNNENIEVTITALGYATVNSTKGQIILSQDPQYKVIASAKASPNSKGIEIDISSIKITSVLSLH